MDDLPEPPIPPNSLDLPFERMPRQPMQDLDGAQISGGVVVMAATLPIDGILHPAIVFRFSNGRGDFYPPIVMITDQAEQMDNLPGLIQAAVEAARSACNE